MLRKDTEIFLQHPNETTGRILHRGKVIEVDDNITKVRFEQKNLDLPIELEFLVYYELKQGFVKQGARIVCVIDDHITNDESGPSIESHPYYHYVAPDEPRPLVGFETTSEPVSAESRQCYRVSTAISDRTATVGNHECELLDLSITGLAVISSEDHKIGNIVPVTLHLDGKRYSGTACIQSIRELPTGATRYGLLCSDDRNSDAELKKSLQKMSMTLQREQLRRMAGAA